MHAFIGNSDGLQEYTFYLGLPFFAGEYVEDKDRQRGQRQSGMPHIYTNISYLVKGLESKDLLHGNPFVSLLCSLTVQASQCLYFKSFFK
jgi:hypothetical protein